MNSMSVRWEDLPPDLVATIHGNLQDVADLVRFRWVCRSWRISAAPLPNKLSPFFPLKLPHPAITNHDLTINANAVYLVRPRRDPSKAWMVSIQEPVVGNLVLLHALTYDEIPNPGGGNNNLFDLSPDDWMLTQVARSYSRSSIKKVSIITNPCRGSIQLVIDWHEDCLLYLKKPFFVLDLSGEVRKIVQGDGFSKQYTDFVNFNGWIYTIDDTGNFYLVDHKKSRLLPVAQIRYLCSSYNSYLVVSDGVLYVVVTYDDYGSFWICRLVIKAYTYGMITRGKWKRVEDSGERVFFLAKNCSFSVSVRDLPRPWEGNCVVVGFNGGDREGRIFFVKGQHQGRSRSLSSLEGYSDLFKPSSS